MPTTRPPLLPVTTLVVVASAVATVVAWLDLPFVLVLAPGPLSEPWRVVTAALLHGDVLHLVFNLLWTWQLGTLIERHLGSVVTLLLFAVLITVSGIAQLLLDGPGIGLSGMVYGLFGLLWVARRRGLPLGYALSDSIVRLFVAWFFIAILLDYLGMMRIGNVAHGSGAIAGAILGLLLPRRGSRHKPW